MSHLLSRLLLAMVSVAAAPVSYFCVFVVVEHEWLHADFLALLVTDVIIAVLFAICWVAIWSPQVTWTHTRRRLTACSLPASVAAASALGLALALLSDADELGVIVAGMAWIVIWMASTVLIWRETRAERAARLRAITTGTVCCLRCGYNMTGLHEARCPECGTQYTLNELLAAATSVEDHLDGQ
jgi:hypothetical protein